MGKAKSTRSKNTSADEVVDEATAYARAIVAKKLVAGALVRLACARHLDDLKNGKKRGLAWDVAAAQRVIKFFPDVLRFAEGQHAGNPFELQPWQKFVVGSLFGWKRLDGARRFRTAYCEIGKGNGKSPVAAGIGLYGLIADREQAAEVYAAATALSQAKICFRDAELMVEKSPTLSMRIVSTINNLAFVEASSFFRPISAEKRGLDGKRVHMALIDELHEHPDATVVDKMRAGTKGRRQALIIEITNSGYDRNSVCYQHHDYSIKILQGVLPNDSWFAFICGLDPCEKCRGEGFTQPNDKCDACDDWRDERLWQKANPNLDVSISREYLREQVQEAIGMPSKSNIVRRLNFCIWTEHAERWLDMTLWDRCPTAIDLAALDGRHCFPGLDLSSTTDVSALELVFPPESEDEEVKVLSFFWVPEENARQRSERDRVPYEQWIREGLIEATPGNVIDYDFIHERIRKLAEKYNFGEFGYDPWNATQLVTQLQADGFTMVPVRQGMLTLSAPSKELEKLVLSRRINHGANPVLRWMAANVTVTMDAAGNIKPDKDKSTERIDGIVALVVALSRSTVATDSGSVYDERGIDFV